MMPRRKAGLCAVVLSILAGCSTTDPDKTADFNLDCPTTLKVGQTGSLLIRTKAAKTDCTDVTSANWGFAGNDPSVGSFSSKGCLTWTLNLSRCECKTELTASKGGTYTVRFADTGDLELLGSCKIEFTGAPVPDAGRDAASDRRLADTSRAETSKADTPGADSPSSCSSTSLPKGCCKGQMLYTCETGKLVSMNCGADNGKCGWSASASMYECGSSEGADPSGTYPRVCPF